VLTHPKTPRAEVDGRRASGIPLRQVRGREHASDHAPAWIEIADAKAMVPRRGRRFREDH
jgi:hypothetical protein